MKIEIHNSKTLKLTNALVQTFSKEEDFEQLEDFEKLIEQMDLHIRQKGAQPIGPLVQKMELSVDDDGAPKMLITFIRQADNFIHHVDAPYSMGSVIRETNCLYTRFIGEEKDIQFAYNKLNLVGYEEEIPLTGVTYTVFVDSNEDDGTLTADIFMPRADG
jgi:uncharacterized protein YecE (DUF72 family)